VARRDFRPQREWTWPLALGAALFAMLTSIALFCVIWVVVPHQAERLADLGTPLAAPTAITLFFANWFIRLLPFVCFLSVPIGALVLVSLWIAFKRQPRARFIRTIGVSASVVAFLELLASGVMVFSMYLS